MLTEWIFLLLGGVLVLLALAEAPLQRLPATPAVIALAIGWLVGWAFHLSGPKLLVSYAQPLVVITELVLISSLFAVGLRLLPQYSEWRIAVLLAGPCMLVFILLATLTAQWFLALPWPIALLLASILAPTDPVLASDVQIRSQVDRDSVRISLTAEGGLNDGSAFPAVMLALGLLGFHSLGKHYTGWLWSDLVWPLGGGVVFGVALGNLLGLAIGARLAKGDGMARDELLYVGALALGYAISKLLGVSPFMLSFALGASLLRPVSRGQLADDAKNLAERLHLFSRRFERLVEALTVLALGILLAGLKVGVNEVVFALLLIVALRPLSVIAVVRRKRLSSTQRRLVGWFGIRGIGSVFYLVFALEHGIAGDLADRLISVVLTCVALSIVLHGISATPLMDAYQRRRKSGPPPPA